MAAATGTIVYGPDRDGGTCFVDTRDWLGDPRARAIAMPRCESWRCATCARTARRRRRTSPPGRASASGTPSAHGHRSPTVSSRSPTRLMRHGRCDALGSPNRRMSYGSSPPSTSTSWAGATVRSPSPGPSTLGQPRGRHDPPRAHPRRTGRGDVGHRRRTTASGAVRAAGAIDPPAGRRRISASNASSPAPLPLGEMNIPRLRQSRPSIPGPLIVVRLPPPAPGWRIRCGRGCRSCGPRRCCRRPSSCRPPSPSRTRPSC